MMILVYITQKRNVQIGKERKLMKKTPNIRKMIITAMCIALCVVLPMAVHAIPNAGSIFSPMHIPVLLCALICGWHYGLFCGLAGPFLASLITGMPPMAYLPSMLVELAVYGLVTGLMIQVIRTKKIYVNLYASLIIGMIVGRLVAGLAQAAVFSGGGYTMTMWVTSYFITAWPAIVIQLAVLPTLVYALQKARLISIG